MSNSVNNDEVLRECATVGAAVLAAQRIEFLLYGIIAHVKPELKGRDKKFRHLGRFRLPRRRAVRGECGVESSASTLSHSACLRESGTKELGGLS